MPEAAAAPVNVISPSPGFMGAGASVGFPADVADKLPAAARDRLIDLRNRKDDLRAASSQATDKLLAAQQAMNDIARRAQILGGQLSTAKYDPKFQPADRSQTHPSLVMLNAEALRCRAELDHVKGRSDKLNTEWQEVARLVEAIKSYIASTAEPLTEFSGLVVQGFAPIDKIRAQVSELKDKISATKGAPILRAEAKALMREQVNAIAQAGQPSISALIAHGGAIIFPFARNMAQAPHLQLLSDDASRAAVAVAAASAGMARAPDGISFVCWLLKEPLIKQLERDIDQAGDDAKALSAADRQTQVDRLRDELLRTERTEAEACASEHTPLRSDIDPRAVLQIDGPELVS